MGDVENWVRGLYASVLDEESMRRQLESLADLFNANYVALQFEGQRRFFLMSNRALGELLHRYEAKDYENPFIERGTARLLSGVPVRGSEVVTTRDVHRSAFYADIMRPIDVEHSLGGLVWQAGDNLAIVSINRPPQESDFSESDSLLLRRLLPDMRVAVELHLKARERFVEGERAVATLEDITDGLFWLTHEGRLLRCNEAGREMLEAPGLVSVDARSRLVIASAERNLYLNKSIAGGETRTIAITDGAGRVTHVASLEPLSASASFVFASGSAALLRVRDLRSVREPPGALLQQLFGLTPREAAVCLAVLHNPRGKAVARRLGVGPDTLKTHLSRIYRKTRCAGRSELVHLVERLAD